jgi:hypothetical protein
MALKPFVRPWPLLYFRNLFYTDGRTPWTGDKPVARPLPTHKTTQTHNKLTQTSMRECEDVSDYVNLKKTVSFFFKYCDLSAQSRDSRIRRNIHC